MIRFGRSQQPAAEKVDRFAEIAGRTVGEVLPGWQDSDWYLSRVPRPAYSTPEIDAREDRLRRLRDRLGSAPARRDAAARTRDTSGFDQAVNDERILPDEIWRLEQEIAAARAEHLNAESHRVAEEAGDFLVEQIEVLRWVREYVGREYGKAVAAETAARAAVARLGEQASEANAEVGHLWARKMRKSSGDTVRIEAGLRADPFLRDQHGAAASTTIHIHTPRHPWQPERVTTTSSAA